MANKPDKEWRPDRLQIWFLVGPLVLFIAFFITAPIVMYKISHHPFWPNLIEQSFIEEAQACRAKGGIPQKANHRFRCVNNEGIVIYETAETIPAAREAI